MSRRESVTSYTPGQKTPLLIPKVSSLKDEIITRACWISTSRREDFGIYVPSFDIDVFFYNLIKIVVFAGIT